MTIVNIARRMRFRPADLYAIIVDVGAYKEFLPLCDHSRTWNHVVDGEGVERFCAELSITYDELAISERLTCDVVADPRALTVTATSRKSPVKRLENRWTLKAIPEGTDVIFRLDYVMASRTLQFLLSGMFDYAMRKIMTAFEAAGRCVLLPAVPIGRLLGGRMPHLNPPGRAQLGDLIASSVSPAAHPHAGCRRTVTGKTCAPATALACWFRPSAPACFARPSRPRRCRSARPAS